MFYTLRKCDDWMDYKNPYMAQSSVHDSIPMGGDLSDKNRYFASFSSVEPIRMRHRMGYILTVCASVPPWASWPAYYHARYGPAPTPLQALQPLGLCVTTLYETAMKPTTVSVSPHPMRLSMDEAPARLR